MPDRYITYDQAAAMLMKASKLVKRRTVPSQLRGLASIPDPDNAGQRLWLESDVERQCENLRRPTPGGTRR